MNERLILTTKRLFLSCALALTAHAQWEQLPPLPEPNGGFMCGHHDGKIVIAGGTNWEGGKKNWLSGVYAFDVKEQRWMKLNNMPSPIAYGLGFSHSRDLLLLGGSDGKQTLKVIGHAIAGRLSPEPQLPDTTVLCAGGLMPTGLIFVGGTNDAANLAGLSKQSFFLGKEGMERLPDYTGKPFAVAASAVAGDELLVFGGMNYDEATKAPANSTEANAFSPEKNAWRRLRPLEVANRGLTAVVLKEGNIYLAGGYTEDFTADAVIYDVKSDSYHNARPLPYAAMVGLVKMGEHVYCLGGEDKKQSRTDKFFRIPVAELLK